MTQEPTAELHLQWEDEAREYADAKYTPKVSEFAQAHYLAARLVAYQEYQKLLEEKDREIAELRIEVKTLQQFDER